MLLDTDVIIWYGPGLLKIDKSGIIKDGRSLEGNNSLLVLRFEGTTSGMKGTMKHCD